MNIKEHRQHVTDELTSCNLTAQSLFVLLCAERLRNCCWAYQASSGVSFEVYFEWSDILFEMLLNPDLRRSNLVPSAIQDLEAILPTGGEPLFVQGQSAIICLLSALEICSNGHRLSVSDSVNAIIDAIDNYDFFIRRRLKNDNSSPANYTLLQREVGRQLSDVAFVKMQDRLNRVELIEYRYENLQFAVPIAV